MARVARQIAAGARVVIHLQALIAAAGDPPGRRVAGEGEPRRRIGGRHERLRDFAADIDHEARADGQQVGEEQQHCQHDAGERDRGFLFHVRALARRVLG